MQIVRESIFVSAIRAFINAFFALIGVLIGLLVLGAVLSSLGKSASKSPFANLELEVIPDHKGNSEILSESTPVILNIDIEGVIGLEDLTSDIIHDMLLASRQGILKGNRVKGIILNINSPGGAATDSADIYHYLKHYKEMYNVPILASVNGFCASGGYFIACAADSIEATALSIIGSVGVRFGPNFNFYELMQKLGIREKTFTAGKFKVKWPMFEKLPAEDKEEKSYSDLEKTVAATYEIFLDAVSGSRSQYGLTKTLLENEYGAQIYIAKEAKQKGYINQDNVYYYETLQNLLKMAEIEDSNYQLYRFRHKPSIVESLVRGKVCKFLLSPFDSINKQLMNTAQKPLLLHSE